MSIASWIAIFCGGMIVPVVVGLGQSRKRRGVDA